MPGSDSFGATRLRSPTEDMRRPLGRNSFNSGPSGQPEIYYAVKVTCRRRSSGGSRIQVTPKSRSKSLIA